MANLTLFMLLVLVAAGVMIYHSQNKFKNKMLCTFIRPNRQRIEKWVPLQSTHVIFDRGKYGVGRYVCDPKCITMTWFDRGINKLFPTLIPTLEFKWNSPYPLDPRTFKPTWHTPEARQAAWEEHQHIAFAKAAAIQAGAKGKIPSWVLPVATIGLLLVVLYLVWSGMAGLDERMFYLEQQMKLMR